MMLKLEENAAPVRPGLVRNIDALRSPSEPASIRTPWGAVDFTDDDRDATDPLEPAEPITWDSPLASRDPSAGRKDATLSPQDLHEMLMTPAAQPSRSSPARRPAEVSADPQTFPAQADLVLSALEVGGAAAPKVDRRGQKRRAYRVKAALRLFSDASDAPGWTIYTRDIHSRGLGFITPHRLPLGYGGVIELPDPDNSESTLRVPCTLLRCREAAPGWYEGSLYFNREQPGFRQG